VVRAEVALVRLGDRVDLVCKAISSVYADRGAGHCVTLPFGTLSLFELADFTTAHVLRHISQIERTHQRLH
jgi:hypothetical protein